MKNISKRGCKNPCLVVQKDKLGGGGCPTKKCDYKLTQDELISRVPPGDRHNYGPQLLCLANEVTPFLFHPSEYRVTLIYGKDEWRSNTAKSLLLSFV